MSNKRVKEWSIVAPWGKIAMISWGNPVNKPILMAHGYMDSAATFLLLVDLLPNKYYYVGFDLPGHGKSDPLPKGLLLTQLHMVDVIRRIVDHMKWKKFVYMAHSMGCVIGLLYNHLYPEYIKKMVLLDPGPPLAMYYLVHNRQPLWYQFLYADYYDNYQKWNSGKPRLYTYDSAVSLVVRNRSLTEDQAEVILSRSLVSMGIDTYKLSWEPRMKKLSQVPISEETLYTLMTAKTPPTLVFDASESKGYTSAKKFAENLLHKCELTLPNFNRITVEGGHDVHITNPELLVSHMESFLVCDKDNNYMKSKI